MATYASSNSMGYLNGHNDMPYEPNLQQVGPTEYSDARLVQLLTTNGLVDMDQNPVSGEVRPIQNHEVAHIGNGNNNYNKNGGRGDNNRNDVGGHHAPEPQIPTITITAEHGYNSRNSPSASRINTAKLSDGALRILRTCKYQQQLFATALQHFDLHFQFFDSSLNGDRFQRYNEIEPTMHAALRAGNELVPPHKHFSDAVKQYRIFLGMELLVYLDPQGSVTREIAKKFNELSEEYGDKEGKIRTAMGVMYHRTSGGGKKMIDEYVDMFKQRQKLLQSQFMELKALVERTLTEINKIA